MSELSNHECPTCQSIGTFSRLNYDNCAYDKRVSESVSPLGYRLSRFKYENNDRCTYDGIQHAPFDPELVDQETELRGITRPGTRCPSLQYNKNCKKSKTCTNTYDKSVPVVYPANLCPVVHSNLYPMASAGYFVSANKFAN
jgi:hypothetical protein